MCATICRTPGAHSRRLGFNGSAGETTRLSNSGIVSYSSPAKQDAVAQRCARPGNAVVVCCSGITNRATTSSIPAHRNVFSHPSSHHYLPAYIVGTAWPRTCYRDTCTHTFPPTADEDDTLDRHLNLSCMYAALHWNWTTRSRPAVLPSFGVTTLP
jgi:hypothetical protein